MKFDYYNNLGFGIVALSAVLSKQKTLRLSKLLLILPFATHKGLLQYLARKDTRILSLEKLLIDKTPYFSNFNRRYYDSITLTINALQYLNEMGYVKIEKGEVTLVKNMPYDTKMGKRAEKVFEAAKNISPLLNDDVTNIYLNLRIEL